MDKEAIRGKRRARRLIVQALYQWLIGKHELLEIETQFRVANNMERVDTEYFRKLLYGIPNHLSILEEGLLPYLDRPLESLNPIELCVLRLGAYELYYCPEIPYRVILDEAISIAKEFGSQDGHRYVNGVLHQLAQKQRTVEIEHGRE